MIYIKRCQISKRLVDILGANIGQISEHNCCLPKSLCLGNGDASEELAGLHKDFCRQVHTRDVVSATAEVVDHSHSPADLVHQVRLSVFIPLEVR